MNEKEMEPPIIKSAKGRARLLNRSRLLPKINGTGMRKMKKTSPVD
jgi:hypothetical protein